MNNNMNNNMKRVQNDNRQVLLNGNTKRNTKRVFHILTAVIVMAITACDDYNHSISDIEDRVDHIEGTTLTTVDQQVANINVSIENLEALDEALQQLIDDLQVKADDLQSQLDDNLAADTVTVQTLENEIANIKVLIAELQKKDTELEKKIADLRAYVDGEISATENWANATFVTLTQYADMQGEIANLKQLLKQHRDEITAAYTKKVEEAILTSEESMKAWVNKHLTEGYYDIAAIDAKLASLEAKLTNADATLQKEIEDQQAALAQAKEELTVAYQKAIADAIETNNGKINAAIADAIKNVQDKVGTRLAVIDNAIAAIRKDIEDIISSIASIQEQIASIIIRIQCIRFLPEYSDGKILLTSSQTSATMNFILSPAEAASTIAEAHTNGSPIVSAYISLTTTRTVGEPTALSVEEVTGNENGRLVVTIDAENVSWGSSTTANIFIKIADGNNDIISEMIPVEYNAGS